MSGHDDDRDLHWSPEVDRPPERKPTLAEFLEKVQADVDVANGHWSPAADLASQIIAEEHAPAMLRMLQSVATSYDHAYDEWVDDGYMHQPELSNRDGYRHRDRQVREAMEQAIPR